MNPKSHEPKAQRTQSTAVPVPPRIPSGDEVYDTIMSEVEPELTTSKLPLLKEKYKDETVEESKVRAKRYKEAFLEYDRRYQQYLLEQKGMLRIYKHNLIRSSEGRLTAHEGGVLTDLESQISQS